MNSTTTLRAYDDDANRQRDIFSKDNALLTHINNETISINGSVSVSNHRESIEVSNFPISQLDSIQSQLDNIQNYLSLLVNNDNQNNDNQNNDNQNNNNQEENLIKKREDGKCYNGILRYNTTDTTNDYFAIFFNPDDSEKTLYLYENIFTCQGDSNIEVYSTNKGIKNLSVNGQPYGDGRPASVSNLKLGNNNNSVAVVRSVNSDVLTFFNINPPPFPPVPFSDGIILENRANVNLFAVYRFRNESNSFFINFHESYLEIPPGYGLVFKRGGNDRTDIMLRWYEE